MTSPSSTNEFFRVAVVGAGPAGLSAACRAAALERKSGTKAPSHILLEAFGEHAKTIQCYQKGKHVMDEPGYLGLRSDLRFTAGNRETVLGNWLDDYLRLGVNIRTGAPVTAIRGKSGDFTLTLGSGETIRAEKVVLAIGTEGNPRRVDVPGDNHPNVQYQLDDPDAYQGESILVIGAGDAAIENALALAKANKVQILNRGKEFSRAKAGNLSAILAALTDPDGNLKCLYGSAVKRIDAVSEAGVPPLSVALDTPTGEVTVSCHRIIARLGSIASRRFIESTGISFPSQDEKAVPELSKHYESNVPGIFIVGSLAGYPLIKQAMNQGYDVAEYIFGNESIKPIDQQLIDWQFSGMPFFHDADEVLATFKRRVPMLRELNDLAFRELILESEISVAYREGPDHDEELAKSQTLIAAQARDGVQARATRIIVEGKSIYEPGEYGSSFFTIVQGSVTLETPGNAALKATLKQGDFFGETSLLSGRPRSERAIAGAACVLVETPRRTMLKLMRSNEKVRSSIDHVFIARELQRNFAPAAPITALKDLAARMSIVSKKAGDVVFTEGDKNADSLYVVRSGGLTMYRSEGNVELAVAQIAAGGMAGEMALMGDSVRRESARATLASELLEIKRSDFKALVAIPGSSTDVLRAAASQHATNNARIQVQPGAPSMMNFLMGEGLGEATDVLIINESLCVGCDNCEKACAETHDGISRLNRKAGATYAHIHVPVSCRHCDQPHCMKDCPPNAIQRSATGEVYINETCIGCGACVENCPYDAIRMAYDAPEKPGLLSWLLFGAGPGMGEEAGYAPDQAAEKKGKKAVKCDACINVASGPACVKACPTGAAIRIGPAQYPDLLEERKA